MEPPPPEFTFICIDNSTRMFWLYHDFKAQLEAIELYCATLFQLNPDSKVCLYAMSSFQSRIMLQSTSDLQEILRCLKALPCDGDTDFSYALACACSTFSRSPPNMKRTLLMFVGSRLDLQIRHSMVYGEKLRERDVALSVFNFFRLKLDTSVVGLSILEDEYHYARDELCTLVTTVDSNENSQIVDVDESCILDILSNCILEKNLHYREEKAAAENEYVEAARIQALVSEYVNRLKTTRNERSRRDGNMLSPRDCALAFRARQGLRSRNKNAVDDEDGNLLQEMTRISGTEIQGKAEENEKYESAAQGKGIKVFIKPETLRDLMRSIEQFHKETITSAADDECFQVPENQYLSKPTPPPRRASLEENQKKMPKKTSAADDEGMTPLELCYLTSCITQLPKKKSAAIDASVQAPEIQNQSEVTPRARRSRKKKKQKEMPIFKQEMELPCNEKNRSAADDENQEKVEENASVKQQELELSCNEKFEAAAQGECIEISIKPELLRSLRRSIEQLHKEISTSGLWD